MAWASSLVWKRSCAILDGLPGQRKMPASRRWCAGAGCLNHQFGEEKSTAMSDKIADCFRAVIPMLVCRDAASEIQFCKAAFGALELSRRMDPVGTVVHATLKIGEAMIMIHGEFPTLASRPPQPDGSSPVVIYLYLEGVDRVIERALVAGARLLIPVMNAFWGDRVGRIIDPSGHVWNIATRMKESDKMPGTE